MRRGSRRLDWLGNGPPPVKAESAAGRPAAIIIRAFVTDRNRNRGGAPRHLPPQHRSSRISGALGRAGTTDAHRRGSEGQASGETTEGREIKSSELLAAGVPLVETTRQAYCLCRRWSSLRIPHSPRSGCCCDVMLLMGSKNGLCVSKHTRQDY